MLNLYTTVYNQNYTSIECLFKRSLQGPWLVLIQVGSWTKNSSKAVLHTMYIKL